MSSERDLLYGTLTAQAEWLAWVGLKSRYAHSHGWHRWDGTAWQRCPVEDVHAAVRRCLGAVYDRRMAADPSPAEVMCLLRLMDVNWHLGPLMRALRRAVTREEVAV